MADEIELTPEQEESFQKIMQTKEAVLFLIGNLLPLESLMVLNMASVDILMASAKQKNAALETIEMMKETAKQNIEDIDRMGAGYWNNTTLQ